MSGKIGDDSVGQGGSPRATKGIHPCQSATVTLKSNVLKPKGVGQSQIVPTAQIVGCTPQGVGHNPQYVDGIEILANFSLYQGSAAVDLISN